MRPERPELSLGTETIDVSPPGGEAVDVRAAAERALEDGSEVLVVPDAPDALLVDGERESLDANRRSIRTGARRRNCYLAVV